MAVKKKREPGDLTGMCFMKYENRKPVRQGVIEWHDREHGICLITYFDWGLGLPSVSRLISIYDWATPGSSEEECFLFDSDKEMRDYYQDHKGK